MKCEYDSCNKEVDVRMTKKILIRTPSGDEKSRAFTTLDKERFLCYRHASMYKHDGYKVRAYINATPYYNIFGKGRHVEMSHPEGISLSCETSVRWHEQKYCSFCGHKLTHEKRYYKKDVGYHKTHYHYIKYDVVICESCGFFHYDYMSDERVSLREAEENGGFSGIKSPGYDPDYKDWRKTLERIRDEHED